ncbi:hypothetical protein GALMADRAFT_55147 [Galerina marginata CBS 339.88]|uniref:GST N-terminal domain-containing protein n=1 Tax=Galerina marginata (strain CBS 339.88) TaxID=685588 RepID=A0A067TLT2_GALM3|nr:hypothetical protein GALMADRAFT_55147 [Galerina marginata CBS 339.88]
MTTANPSNNSDTGRVHHKECTGDALVTVKAHQNDEDITLFGSCFCPFVQRVWLAFEILGVPYKYYEIDPYTNPKPKELLEVSPKGLVPGLRFNRYTPARSLNESTVILDYLEDLAATTTKRSILPLISNPYARGLAKLQGDHVNRNLVPAFYRYLQAQTEEKQIEGGKDFHASLVGLVALLERAEREIGLGLWIPGETELGWADVMAGPWLLRAKIVLTHYRGFQLPSGDRFNGWLTRLCEHPVFKSTSSTDQLYLDSYERYAFNRPNTSQVANAINEGKALP